MRKVTTRVVIVALVAVGGALGVTLTAQAVSTSSSVTVHGCLNKHTRQIDDVSVKHAVKCPSHTTRLAWNERGRTGARGPRGRTGARGPRGRTGAGGPPGPAAYLVAGILNATTCQPDNPSATTFTGSLVTTGTDAPYCKLTPTTPPAAVPIVTANVNGAISPEFVEEQAASGIDLQTWTTAGVNTTGQASAGLIEFTITRGTG
jgi:hypothetical protein